MEIVKGVYSIKLFFNRTFLLTGENLILIDTGYPYQAKRIISFINAIGRKPDELSFIILTHHHIDHRGSARTLKKLTGAKIVAHTNDVPFIEGRKHSYKGYRIWWVRFLLFITELIFQKEKIKVDIVLKDKSRISNLVVHHTPGHTEGSISLFLYDKKVLFCGDTVPYILGKIRSPNPYSLNQNMESISLKKLSKLDLEILLPGDCKMVLKNGGQVLREFCHR